MMFRKLGQMNNATAHQPMRRIVLLGGVALATAPQIAAAAPKAELWDRWTRHDAGSTKVIDHSAWDKIVKRYVSQGGNGVALFAYDELLKGDIDTLTGYLADMQAVPVSTLSRAEQYPYWINLYNAVTVKVVADHYPVDSIRDIDISPGLFSDGPWGAELATVEGEALTLDEIEHRILRPIWKDRRVHYGVNCASIGCPNLMTQAYTSANIDTMLDEAARGYINHPRGAKVQGGDLEVSSIYEWFKEDFGGNDAGVIAHLKKYAGPDLAGKLNGITSISSDDYDWDLNGSGRARGAEAPARRSTVRATRTFGGSRGS